MIILFELRFKYNLNTQILPTAAQILEQIETIITYLVSKVLRLLKT